MKQTLIKTVILALVLSITFTSCKKSKADEKNYFKYDNKVVEIGYVDGIYNGVTSTSGVFSIQMQFFEKTITRNFVNGNPGSYSGKGDVFLVTLLTNKLDEIEPGTYSFTYVNHPITTFGIAGDDYSSGILINYDAASGKNESRVNIASGQVAVSKSGDDYKFSFNLYTSTNSPLTGLYIGKAVIYPNGKKKLAI